jgi:cytoskeletal protein RodZ
MNEDVFVKQDADELTQRIADRLGERQKKLERMADWEAQERKSARFRHIPILTTLVVAACVGALFFFSPFVGTEQSLVDEMGIEIPTLTDYRAATPDMAEITELMEKEEYEKALEKTEDALNKSDEAIKMLAEATEAWGDDEAVMYDRELELAVNSELRWTYIYLLVKQGRGKDAKKEINNYLKRPEYCEHEAEAKDLLRRLK